LKAIAWNFDRWTYEATLSEVERAGVLARLYSMFKRVQTRATEQDVMRTIERIHKASAIREATVEELQAEILRRNTAQPIASLEDASTIDVRWRTDDNDLSDDGFVYVEPFATAV
jgi:hypothetical protein